MKTIIIKLSGELFSNKSALKNFTKQLKIITSQRQAGLKVGLVVGGGNFFRGEPDGKNLEISSITAHSIGMLATIVNGMMLKDLLARENISCELLSAFDCPTVAQPATQQTIDKAFIKNKCVIFVGGTGNPFFTTDTNAVLRALQTNADEIWKATKVDGIYNSDPITNKQAKRYSTITYQQALEEKLGFMDRTALVLAQENDLTIKVFAMLAKDAFLKTLENEDYASKLR
ncbi:hypothetical protein KAT92_03780 [Candidatus Babeliales bacterium]|nr:hypothetical protein [Candidatus Babeliales bacterium]